MKNAALIFAAFLALVLFFGGLIALEVSVWNECRVDHSWFYCLRLISR